jgi:Membrane protein involved in the export of O-antigen and teichoic acid
MNENLQNNRSLGKDALKLTTSKFITIGISMVSAMLLSRFRTLEEYGTYSQIMTVTTLTTTIIMLGLPNSINYFLARAETNEEKDKFLSVYYTISTFLSCFVGLVLVMSVPLLVKIFANPLITYFIYFLAVFPWTKIICASIEHVLIVYNKSNYIMVYRLLNSGSLLGIIFLIQVCNLNFSVYMMLYVIVEALFALSVYIIVKHITIKFKFNIDKDLIKKIFVFSIPIGLATVVGTLNTELGKLVIGGFLGTEELAVYTNASKELPFTIIASSITAVLLPQMSKLLKKNENMEAVSLWGDATLISFKINCFFSFALVVFAPEIITILYSEKYLAGVGVFRIYSIILMLRCTYFGMVLNASGKTKFILYSALTALGLNIALNYLFFWLFGFIGPAISSFVSILMIQVVQLFATSKILHIKFNKIFQWKAMGQVLRLNILFGLLFAVLKYILPLNLYVGEILESVILGLVWMLLIFFFQFKGLRRDWKKFNSHT